MGDESDEIEFAATNLRDQLSSVFRFNDSDEDLEEEIVDHQLPNKLGIGATSTMNETDDLELRKLVKRKKEIINKRKKPASAFDGVGNELSAWNDGGNSSSDNENKESLLAVKKKKKKMKRIVETTSVVVSEEPDDDKKARKKAKRKAKKLALKAASAIINYIPEEVTIEKEIDEEKIAVVYEKKVAGIDEKKVAGINEKKAPGIDEKIEEEKYEEVTSGFKKRKRTKKRSKLKNRRKDNRPEGSWMKNLPAIPTEVV